MAANSTLYCAGSFAMGEKEAMSEELKPCPCGCGDQLTTEQYATALTTVALAIVECRKRTGEGVKAVVQKEFSEENMAWLIGAFDAIAEVYVEKFDSPNVWIKLSSRALLRKKREFGRQKQAEKMH